MQKRGISGSIQGDGSIGRKNSAGERWKIGDEEMEEVELV